MKRLLACLLGVGLLAQEPVEMGPLPTREMFPLFLLGQAYQPIDPMPVGKGRWKVSLVDMRANTFEFSEVLKDRVPLDPEGRAVITRAYVEEHAAEFADVPLVFFFDEEITRLDLTARYGLTDRTDVQVQWPIQSHYGGWLDSVIEGVHALGFKQFGRDLVGQNQLSLVVMEHGRITFFSQERITARPQDPTISLIHRLLEHGAFLISLHASVKPPLTHTYGSYRAGWDPALSLSARWQPATAHVFYAGVGGVARFRGSGSSNDVQGFIFRDGLGAHAGWEWRRGRVRPFFQLLWQSGWLKPQPYQLLDRPSLQHDLGFHWQPKQKAVFTFRYLNNVSHNANTADMGLGLSLTLRL